MALHTPGGRANAVRLCPRQPEELPTALTASKKTLASAGGGGRVKGRLPATGKQLCAPRTAPMAEGPSTPLQELIDRLRAGDLEARRELVQRSYQRLLALARKALRGFPRVRCFEDSTDVLHDALPRLLRALEAAPPATAADFFGLAARQIKWELHDLVKRYYGPKGPGGKHAPPPSTDGEPAAGPPDSTHEPARLARWSELHAQVEALPPEERAAFDLLWYQGLTQAEAAQVLGVAEVTVRRRWLAARLRLQDLLRDGGLG
jgi:RNA polymerase sigma-70 factor (ECF subfamily)